MPALTSILDNVWFYSVSKTRMLLLVNLFIRIIASKVYGEAWASLIRETQYGMTESRVVLFFGRLAKALSPGDEEVDDKNGDGKKYRYYSWRDNVVRVARSLYEIYRDGEWKVFSAVSSLYDDGNDITEKEAMKMIGQGGDKGGDDEPDAGAPDESGNLDDDADAIRMRPCWRSAASRPAPSFRGGAGNRTAEVTPQRLEEPDPLVHGRVADRDSIPHFCHRWGSRGNQESGVLTQWLA